MRLSQFPLVTTKETPSDAEVISAQLLLRGGFIRKLGAGLYTWLPIGLRVLRKAENIVREEMNRAGAVEVLMPAAQPAELWQQSGRWDQMGDELLRFQDRHQNDYCIGPTHEEVICFHFKQDVRSYKQLPINYYQIQTKFRDERRPRFGLMRGREFLMKDAYSFHLEAEDLAREYHNMRDAYSRIFTRAGVDFRIVKADSGSIGGSASEEFHILANTGEDLLAVSLNSAYAANVEAAECLPQGDRPAPSQDLQKVSTPHKRTCEEVSKFLKVPLTGKVKLLVLQGEHGLVAVALRGDHQLNEVKASKHPKIGTFTMAAPEAVQAAFGCEVGFLGPVGCPIPLIIDHAASVLADFVCGANDNHHHYTGANWLRDAAFTETADLRLVQEGDPAPDGSGAITLLRGIEGGHVFQLGQKYSKAMGLSVLNEKGEAVIPEMGCYGIGVSRLVAATLEQKHDDKGMIWPESLAPFTVIVCPIGADKSEAVKATSEQLYQDLRAKGVEVLLDDRGLRPGPMFADADLIGIPHRIVVGDKGLVNGQVEYKARTAPAAEMLALSEVLGRF